MPGGKHSWRWVFRNSCLRGAGGREHHLCILHIIFLLFWLKITSELMFPDHNLKKNKKKGGRGVLPSSRKAGSSQRGSARSQTPLWKALINPDLCGVLTREAKAHQEGGGLKSRGVAVCLPKMLRLIKSSH